MQSMLARAGCGLRYVATCIAAAVSRFAGDPAGGYSVAFAVALVPILGGMRS